MRRHPVLIANSILASPYFIVALNVAFFVAVRFPIGPLDRSDFAMSWVTMAMDQIIISAGWIIFKLGLKNQRKVDKELREIKRLLEEHIR